MEPSLAGLYFGVLLVLFLMKTKPAFFWEHHKLRQVRQQLGDELTERIGYIFLAFITILFTVGALLDR